MIYQKVGNQIYIVCQKSQEEAGDEFHKTIQKLYQGQCENGKLPKITIFNGKKEFENRCPEALKNIVNKHEGLANNELRKNRRGNRRRCLSGDSAECSPLEDSQSPEVHLKKPHRKALTHTIQKFRKLLNKEEIEENYKNINSKMKVKVRKNLMYRKCLFRYADRLQLNAKNKNVRKVRVLSPTL
jgi:hypothetical protein